MVKIFQKKFFKIIIFLLVFYFTFVLRVHNYERSPVMGNLEEMMFAWAGLYLVEDGAPVAWSSLDYPQSSVVFNGVINYYGDLPSAHVVMVRPWLDQPPLFSYMVGLVSHFFGADKTQFIPTAYIRLPVILFGVVTSLLVFLILKKIDGFWMGVLGMLIYGTVPIMVLGSRISVPENFIMMNLMIVCYLLIHYLKIPKFRYLILIPLIAGLSGLAKPTGFFIAPLAAFFVLWQYSDSLKKKELFFRQLLSSKALVRVLYLFFGTIIFLLAYFLYGIYFDSNLFWHIMSIQGNRPVGFSALGWFIISPSFDWKILLDSWFIFCLLCSLYFCLVNKDKIKSVITISFVYWVLIVTFSGGEGDLLSWYRYPVFPLMAIMGTWGLKEIVNNANFFTTFLVVGLLLNSRKLLVNAFHPNIDPNEYRLIASFLIFPSVLKMLLTNKYLEIITKVIIILVIGAGIYLNAKYIYSSYEVICEGLECILGPTTWLSGLNFPLLWRIFSL